VLVNRKKPADVFAPTVLEVWPCREPANQPLASFKPLLSDVSASVQRMQERQEGIVRRYDEEDAQEMIRLKKGLETATTDQQRMILQGQIDMLEQKQQVRKRQPSGPGPFESEGEGDDGELQLATFVDAEHVLTANSLDHAVTLWKLNQPHPVYRLALTNVPSVPILSPGGKYLLDLTRDRLECYEALRGTKVSGNVKTNQEFSDKLYAERWTNLENWLRTIRLPRVIYPWSAQGAIGESEFADDGKESTKLLGTSTP
jgi:hypothetical protein